MAARFVLCTRWEVEFRVHHAHHHDRTIQVVDCCLDYDDCAGCFAMLVEMLWVEDDDVGGTAVYAELIAHVA